ncbi:MAG: amidohydrolase family protein [Desulfurococcales archaeon]|nr:amidohydrolase family protein [Desulfurococcales archaeon]
MEICSSVVVINPYLVLTNACLKIKGSKIISLSFESGSLEDKPTAITHGLASLHTHLALYPIRHSITYGGDLDSWVLNFAWPWERILRQEPELSYYSAVLALDELVSSGVTAVADMHFNEEYVARAIEEAGIKGDLCTPIMNGGVYDSFEESINENLKLARSLRDKPDFTVRLGPCTPRLLTPDQVKYITELAIELRLGLHMHVGEVYADSAYLTKYFGLSIRDFLEHVGLGAVDTILAHGIWLLDGSNYLVWKPVVIAHSPRSNILLGSGLIDVKNYRSTGVDIALGVDVAPTYNALDELRTFLYAQKLECTDYFDVLYMVTSAPYRSMGFGSGSLSVGEPADVAVWDVGDKLGYLVKSKPYSLLTQFFICEFMSALAEGELRLKELYAGGKLIVRDGKPTVLRSEISRAYQKVSEVISDLYGKSALPEPY